MSTHDTGTGAPPLTKRPAQQKVSVGDRFRLWWNALSRPAQWAIGVPFILLVAALPVLQPPLLSTGPGFGAVMATFGQYALIAIGLNVVVGSAGLLDLGYIGFFAVGAYTVALFTSRNSPWNATGEDGWLSTQWAWLAVLPIAIAVTAVSGLLLGSPTLRLRGDYLAIVTLGFGEIVRLLAENLTELTGGAQGLKGVAFPQIGQTERMRFGVFSQGNAVGTLNAGVWWFWVSIVLIVLVLVIVGNVERSRVGRAWVAVREDEDVAEIMGVPAFKFKLWAFLMGAAIGGLSGALYAGQVQSVLPTGFNVINSVLFLCAVVLGGQGNKLGVILGAFIIVYIPAKFIEIAEIKYLVFGLALMVLMIFRPQGLIPVRQKLLHYGRQIWQAAKRRQDAELAESGTR